MLRQPLNIARFVMTQTPHVYHDCLSSPPRNINYLRLYCLLCKRSHPRSIRPPSFGRQFASQPQAPVKVGIIGRVRQFLRNNPFTRFSLILCGVILTLSIGFEYFTKMKKKKLPAVVSLPPTVGHFVVERASKLETLKQTLNAARRQGSAVVYITGPSGSGKSVLAYQYAKQFSEKSSGGFTRSLKLTLLYLNGSTEDQLESTLRQAALNVGLKESDLNTSRDGGSEGENSCNRLSAISRALWSKLTTNKVPWLIVVDDLHSEVYPTFAAAFTSTEEERDWARGGVVVTTQGPLPDDVPEETKLYLAHKMDHSDAVKLLCECGGLEASEASEQEVTRLAEQLHHFPLALALAASAVKLYSSFTVENSNLGSSSLSVYSDILSSSLSSTADLDEIVSKTVSLYLEATVSNPNIQHAFDLLGSCDLTHPIPTSLIGRHLRHPFYNLPPPTPSLPTPPIQPPENTSYLSQLRNLLPFGRKTPDIPDMATLLAKAEDPIPFLRDCPLLSFKAYNKMAVELVSVHPAARDQLSRLFASNTAPKLDRDSLAKASDNFNRTAWFRQYRTFDPTQALQKYRRTLPGLSAPGVKTPDEFVKNPPAFTTAIGTKPLSSTMSYPEYQHLVSHYHRVATTLGAELRLAGGDIRDLLLKKHLQPHFKAVRQFPLTSEYDKLLCSYGLTTIEAALMSDYRTALQKYDSLLHEQKTLYGSQHPVVAQTLTDIADLKFSTDNTTGSREALESALNIYERLPQSVKEERFLEVGLALSSLGIVCNSLGEKERSKELLEGALAVYQTVPPDGKVSTKQRRLVASTLTDVAHAYLSLGDINSAKKHIDLSIMAHRNMYFDPHPETVRTLNVMSIVYALLGDKPESHRLRLEAGKIQNQLDSQPLAL